MNKKNLFVTTLTLASISLISFSSDHDVYADTKESNASLQFNSSSTTPTNPVDPSNPNNKGENDGTGSVGPLSIDYVPKLNFGTVDISPGDYPLSNGTTNTPFVQVTDKRGTGAGWILSSKISEFQEYQKNQDDSETSTGKTVEGIRITLDNDGNPLVGYGGVQEGNEPNNNTDKKVLTNSSTNIMQASENHGMGTWIQKFKTDTTKISIPASAISRVRSDKSYLATITWTLADGVQSEPTDGA